MYKLIAEQWNATHTCVVTQKYKTREAAYTAARQLAKCGYACHITGKDGWTLFL
jgi:hypothetical protein